MRFNPGCAGQRHGKRHNPKKSPLTVQPKKNNKNPLAVQGSITARGTSDEENTPTVQPRKKKKKKILWLYRAASR